MAEQVWKCDHCKYTNDSLFEVSEHEKECSLNSKNKKCFTCIYYEEMGYPMSGSDMRCINKDNKKFYDIWDFEKKIKNEDFPCEYWEISD